MSAARACVLSAIVALSALLLAACDPAETPGDRPVSASIAVMPYSFTSYTVFLAKELGLFREEGVDLELRRFSYGQETLGALVERRVDYAVSSETPFIHAVLEGAEIRAVAVLTRAHQHLTLVARRDRGIATVADLQGRRIGVTQGSNGEYFLEVVLALHGLATTAVDRIHVLPENMVSALETGEVDAIAAWNPQAHEAARRLESRAVTFDAEELYSPYFLLVTGHQDSAAHRDTTQRLLRALERASAAIRSNPEQADARVAKRLGADPETLRHMTGSYTFGLSLEQSLLTALENQTEWILARRSPLPGRKPPVYLDYIDITALKAVSPKAVGFVH